MAAKIKTFVEGNRVFVIVTCEVRTSEPGADPEVFAAATPTTWDLYVLNIADGSRIRFKHDGTGNTLPTGVGAAMTNPATGKIVFAWDVDVYGERKYYFKGTGACKCADEGSFGVTKGEANP